jgi:hypothetical protein
VTCRDELSPRLPVRAMKNRATKLPSKRPAMPRVSEEVRVFSDFLMNELLSWPGVSVKPMFGLRGLYRGPTIFAALPATRALNTSCSMSFKLPTRTPGTLKALQSDDRIVTSDLKTHNWFSFEVRSDKDIPDAIQWFTKAYQQAGKASEVKPKRPATRR